METIQINDNIRVTCIGMTKLKTTSLGVYIHRPLRAEEASYNALLPLVLKRGSNLCPDQESVAKYLDQVSKEVGSPVKVTGFVRFETGEGIEKKEENFAEEVAKQMAGN